MQCWMAKCFYPGSWATFNGATLMAARGRKWWWALDLLTAASQPPIWQWALPAAPDLDEEGKMICQTLFFNFFFSGENPWMADVHPNPLSNRKRPRSGGGGGDCYCLLAGVLLQWLVRGSLFSGQEKSGLSMGCGSAWNSTSRSEAAFVSKPLQILTKEPKLVMEGKIISLQQSIH